MMSEDNKPPEIQVLTDQAKASLARIGLLFDDLAVQIARLKQEVRQSKAEVTETLATKKS